MKGKIKSIKNQLESQKKKNNGRLVIPLSIWQKIYECSKVMPIAQICEELNIDTNNARRRMRQFNSDEPKVVKRKSKSSVSGPKPSLVQLENTQDCGNSPLMEISLPSGASIKVYTA